MDEAVCQEATVSCGDTFSGYNSSVGGDLGPYDLNNCGAWSAPNDESIYRLIAPYDGWLHAAFDSPSQYGHDMFLLEGDCSPSSCVAGYGNQLSQPMQAGVEYYIVVEQSVTPGYGSFTFDITCSP